MLLRIFYGKKFLKKFIILYQKHLTRINLIRKLKRVNLDDNFLLGVDGDPDLDSLGQFIRQNTKNFRRGMVINKYITSVKEFRNTNDKNLTGFLLKLQNGENVLLSGVVSKAGKFTPRKTDLLDKDFDVHNWVEVKASMWNKISGFFTKWFSKLLNLGRRRSAVVQSPLFRLKRSDTQTIQPTPTAIAHPIIQVPTLMPNGSESILTPRAVKTGPIIASNTRNVSLPKKNVLVPYVLPEIPEKLEHYLTTVGNLIHSKIVSPRSLENQEIAPKVPTQVGRRNNSYSVKKNIIKKNLARSYENSIKIKSQLMGGKRIRMHKNGQATSIEMYSESSS
jgi:hypothetical protein